jgi:tRNA 2-thiocytidine biosynthesis protein TtcA
MTSDQQNMARLERRLFNEVRDTCREYELLEPGERVLVAVSGGKDSYTLLRVLSSVVQAHYPSTSLIAVHLDQRQPGYDGAPLRAYLEAHGYEFEILSEDTYSVVIEQLEPGATYCSLCSRLRRGILYSAAERIGCSKIALGHHRDDGLETFLMNLFYSGRLQAMPARYTTDDGRFQVIRPLINSAERTIAEFAQLAEFPILPCNLCGSQEGLRREAMTRLLDDLEREAPNVRAVMQHALKNVRSSHLLDVSLAQSRREHAPPGPRPAERPRHYAALPVYSARPKAPG